MTKHNPLNVKLSNSHLNKLKSGIKSRTEITLKLSSVVVCSSNDKTNFQHKLLLTNTQVSRLRKTFANGSSANINFSKTQLSKMIQLGGFSSFDLMLNPAKAASETISEVQDLASEVSDDKFNKIVDIANIFKKTAK